MVNVMWLVCIKNSELYIGWFFDINVVLLILKSVFLIL